MFKGNQARPEAAAAAPARMRLGDECPLRVLLAEDNAVNPKVPLRFLERLGYSANAVANGLEALESFAARARDDERGLLDLQMPEMDGLEPSRQIRPRLPKERQPKDDLAAGERALGRPRARLRRRDGRLHHRAGEAP